jgi:hypothetical protein
MLIFSAHPCFKVLLNLYIAKAKQYALKGYGIKNYKIFVLKFEVVFYIFKKILKIILAVEKKNIFLLFPR